MKFLIFFAIIFFSDLGRSNVIGTDAQNFNPTTSGLDFVTVHSSETLDPGIFNVGFFINYAINTLPVFEETPGSRVKVDDELWSADFSIGVGLLPNWDVGLTFPYLFAQDVENTSTIKAEFASLGNTEVRFNTKYHIWGNDLHGLAGILSANFNRIGNNPYVGQDAGPTINLEVAYDHVIGKIAIGGNLGYRFRNSGTPIAGFPIEPYKDQVLYSGAVSFLIPNMDTKIIGEIYGTFPADSVVVSPRSQSAAELLAGAKHDLNPNLALHFGLGTELSQANASADWRLYTGIHYAFGPVWKKPQKTVEQALAPKEAPRAFAILDIQFAFDSDRVEGESSIGMLNDLAQYLKENSEFKVLNITGHTDSVGSDSYNLDLSRRRANNIKKYPLEKHKDLSSEKIRAEGRGEAQPISDNGNYQGRKRNRRVEFELLRQ